MHFIADLHVHSPFSRATSKSGNLTGLAAWARIKGIQVLGTGDFTHPGWFRQLRELLEPAEPGLFVLKKEAAPEVAKVLTSLHLNNSAIVEEAAGCRFLLSAEISSIYKRHGKVRKVHNLLYVPDFESAERINSRLAALGNIESDGRPILGLDSRNLLEILLEKAPEGFLVPAHIWTPWFSLFGSKSGFDSIEECFGDLTEHIFALETGLSSDPDMNRLISALDRYSLISNSDCHSPAKLGREANLFDTDLSFYAMRDAMRDSQSGFSGTIEFYPEEGKYHFDGHRKCQVCFEPAETRKHNGICPVCGRPLTVGVSHRVMELADRSTPRYAPGSPVVHSLIPLTEVIGEILDSGPATKGVTEEYRKLISWFGSEFNLLLNCPIEEIRQRYSPLLAEAVQRIRTGKVIRDPGYDGEFGVIKVFAEGERAKLAGQLGLFGSGKLGRHIKQKEPANSASLFKKKDEPEKAGQGGLKELNPEQAAAVATDARHCIITAGPGTGKTFTLVSRMVRLIKERQVAPGCMAAITFTNRAAAEVRERLAKEAGAEAAKVFVGTFHGFCLHWLRTRTPELTVAGEDTRLIVIKNLFPGLSATAQKKLTREIGVHLNSLAAGPELPVVPMEQQEMVDRYLCELAAHNTIDLEAVIPSLVKRLQGDDALRQDVLRATVCLFIDEFQDLNLAQYQLVSLLAPSCRVFAIGDPDQAIYGFRGSRPEFFFKFIDEFKADTLHLTSNYRSAPAILAAAGRVICLNPLPNRKPLTPKRDYPTTIELYRAATPAEEAQFIVRRIEEALGGISHFSINTGRGGKGGGEGSTSFGDIAILYRLSQQATEISQALEQRGIPFQVVDVEPFYMRPQIRAGYYWLQVAAGTGDHADHLCLLRQVKGAGENVVRRLEPIVLLGRENFFQAAKDLDLSPKPMEIIGELQSLTGIFADKVAQAGLAAALKEAMGWLRIDYEQTPEAGRLLDLAGAFGKDLRGFASYLKNNAAATVYDEQAEAVALMTLHAAKGLEFPVVFIAGVEEGLLPCSLPGFFRDRGDNVEEERRLFYVGMTRAKENLILSCSATRTIFGETGGRQISRFVKEIPAHLLRQSDRSQKSEKRPRAVQLKLFG